MKNSWKKLMAEISVSGGKCGPEVRLGVNAGVGGGLLSGVVISAAVLGKMAPLPGTE